MSNLIEASLRHPKPSGMTFTYGTAGFRLKAANMDSVMFRVGVLAALRSMTLGGKSIGCMVTASHNPEPDNGVKLIDPLGEMLVASWEKLATTIANAENSELEKVVQTIIKEENISTNVKPVVLVARDTRPSGPGLVASLLDGVQAMNATYIDYGILSTPQLHYLVRCTNDGGKYGVATEEGYFNKLATSFNKLISSAKKQNPTFTPSTKLIIDGANGVGAAKMKTLLEKISENLSASIVNDGSSGKLNEGCGADFVKVQQTFPSGVSVTPNQRYASFDGDADRLVYFYADNDSKFHLLDGDKIATLAAAFLMDRMKAAGVESGLTIGVVQTAYANGSSTEYLEKVLGVPAPCAKTGVKHLHHVALDYDIGVYFEANGHGTVIFSEKAVKQIDDKLKSGGSNDALVDLRNFIDVINETVGDAISDLLMVETILAFKNWTLPAWDTQYTDLPNKQLKVEVPNRNIFDTTDAERKLVSPAGMQEEIDKLVSGFPKGRSFVRPSGTEDVVRVYAESNTQENTNSLASQVADLVRKFAK